MKNVFKSMIALFASLLGRWGSKSDQQLIFRTIPLKKQTRQYPF